MENFITSIYVENSRNIKDLEIKLSDEKRQHLILTGKNGSGKTSLLEEIYRELLHYTYELNSFDLDTIEAGYKKPKPNIKVKFPLVEGITYGEHYKKWISGEFLLVLFPAIRPNLKHVLNIPSGIKKVYLERQVFFSDKTNKDFVQYILNLKADRSFAKDDNKIETVKNIDNWFDNLQTQLAQIFDVDKLELHFDRDTYNFNIIIKDREPFNFYQLSDGYSAIIDIITELLLRMDAHNAKIYDLEGIVLIDEIETHLHVDLQKKILPFLTAFFPKIQFIVTTHSPFVLSSISNATICDLETKIVTSDLSAYSYGALIESYFEVDEYSQEIKDYIKEYEQLTMLFNPTDEENARLRFLKDYFAHAPKYLSKELLLKLNQIELNELLKSH